MKEQWEVAAEIDSLGISSTNQIMVIKRMGVKVASDYIESTMPKLSTESKQFLLTLAKPTKVEFVKSRFYAVAWCLGATWGQLAQMFGVHRGTVSTSASYHLSASTREAQQTLRTKITPHQLSAIRAVYEELLAEDGQVVESTKPEVIATRIKDIMATRTTQLSDHEEGNPYDQLFGG